MKRPKDDIFRLIKAMTPAEKRYFKRHFASDRSALTDLFNYLNSQSEYEEGQVKAYFGENFSKKLKVYKYQLQRLVLKSLSNFNSKRSVLSKIRLGLEEMEILLEKNLFDMALEVLDRVKDLCLQNEEFTYLLEVLQREYSLQHLRVDKPGLSGHPFFQESEEVLCHYKNHLRLFRLATELVDRDKNLGDFLLTSQERRALRRIHQENQWGDYASPPTFRERVSRNAVLMMVYDLLGEREAGGAFRRNNVELFEAYPHFKTSMSFQYLGALRNYLNFCLEMNHQEEGLELIERAKAVINSNPKLEPHLGYLLEAELRIALDQGRLDFITGKLEKEILCFTTRNNSERERITLNMFAFLALVRIARENLREAHHYIRMLRENAQEDLQDYFYELIGLLEMIGHFESGDEFLVANTIQAVRRRQGRDGKQDPLFRAILELFRRLIRYPDRRRELMNEFLVKNKKHTKGKVSHFLEYFGLVRWFDSVGQGEPFGVFLKRTPPGGKPGCRSN